MIPLAILCAALVVIAWQVVHLRGVVARSLAHQKQLGAMYQENSLHWKEIDRLSATVATAYALLHDERHKGKMGNQAAWIAARDEWAAKVKGAGGA